MSEPQDLSHFNPSVRERLKWTAGPEEYAAIRRLWIKHSIAEDGRNLQGLIDTLAPDCVYEIVPTGQRWEGHDGARRFYSEFLGAFPDVHFDLTDITIGPQGVFEVADVTGTHQGTWMGVPATGKKLNFQVIISFPWNPQASLFSGERIWYDRLPWQELLQG